MKFIKTDSYEKMSHIGANIIFAQLIAKEDSVLGLATGSSPVSIYKELIELNRKGDIDFSLVKTINLDEYVGLDGNNKQSYRSFMNANLFDLVNIDKSNTFIPNGCAEDLEAECKAYDKIINDLGIDIQLLGIGLDGHIGFNEPDSYFVRETHVVDLDDSTIKANARFFGSEEEVPRRAVTMGIGGIMSAKKILLIANGPAKEDIINKAFFGPITPEIPASVLQLHHDVTVIFSEV